MNCEICNQEFVPKHKRALTCSIECRKTRQKKLNYLAVKARRHNIKLKAIEYKGGKCILCGYMRCKEGLEFHHLEPEHKDFSISHRINLGWYQIKTELDKCVLVCATCHREVHAGFVSINLETLPPPVDIEIKTHDVIRLHFCNDCGDRVYRQSEHCVKCSSIKKRKVARPEKDELAKLLWEYPTVQLGLRWGVSDKAIEKWAKNWNLPKPPRGWWSKQTPQKED